MLFGVPWLFGTFWASQVAYRRSLSGCPLKMKHGILITDWHFWQSRPYLRITPTSFFVTPPPPPRTHACSTGLFIFLAISLTHTLLSVSLHLSRLTAIRHWPSSLCLLPLPPVQPSHNYFLWFTVVGHCHPPEVFTAEITHTVFSDQTYLHRFHYPLHCPEALVRAGFITNADSHSKKG